MLAELEQNLELGHGWDFRTVMFSGAAASFPAREGFKPCAAALSAPGPW